jgi:hypothetical protein
VDRFAAGLAMTDGSSWASMQIATGLDPAIHVFDPSKRAVDDRVKPGHDAFPLGFLVR